MNRGATFQVTWTGPNGPSDYITIVAAGATAPAAAGNYEIWYASDRVPGLIFARTNIVVH